MKPKAQGAALLAAAEQVITLLERGNDPDGIDALISTIGEAAGLAVEELDRAGPYFKPWQPPPSAR